MSSAPTVATCSVGLIRSRRHFPREGYDVYDDRTPSPRPRRSFREAFNANAVRLVLDEGKSVCAAARDLDLTASSLRKWGERARADAGKGKPGALTSAAREELSRLRKENRILQEEREILRKAAAFFAKHSRGGSGLWPRRRRFIQSASCVGACV